MGLFSFRKQVEDPVCGMQVDPKKAAGSAEHEGRRFYFCSVNCMGKFQAEAHRYGHPPA